ncbi:MAG: metalloregulator ArsR/SmtB family transcription factor [Gemmatimonadota bacterium]|nr:metalloregulator ArsR/SmtB family transcription factor [Gemmatimonadota bacterium]
MTSPRSSIHDRLTDLADATRCRLLLALEAHELTVGELGTALQLPQSTVSRHLRILADESWVTSRADGASRWYRMALQLDPSAASLWHIVRAPMLGTPGANQDSARIDSVLLARRARSEAFFASAATEWDATRASLYGNRADLGALLALLNPNWVVGDLGCGTGTVTAAIAPHVKFVHAVDASPEMLASARERLAGVPNVQLSSGALEHLPLDDASLDVAIMLLVLHHVAEPSRALSEVQRVLRPGGRLLVIDMRAHAHEEYRQQMGHVWLGFDEHALHAWLQPAGFINVRYVPLAVEPGATGPSLFSATAETPVDSPYAGTRDFQLSAHVTHQHELQR